MRCRSDAVDEEWRCRTCGLEPPEHDGIRCFAPDLAWENDGMDAGSHAVLDRIQERSFWFRARNRLIEDLVSRHFASARHVLELGCGTGYVTQCLRRALPDAHIRASEIYLDGLAFAAARMRGAIDFMQMDARRIPFRNEFDLVCAFDVLEHISEDEAVLAEIVASLAPGGGVVLSVPQHPALWSSVDAYSHHKRRYRRRELADKAAAAGLRVVRSTSFVTSLLPLMFLQRVGRRKVAPGQPQDEHELPRVIDRLFEAALDGERRAIGGGVDLPLGGSRFVVGFL